MQGRHIQRVPPAARHQQLGPRHARRRALGRVPGAVATVGLGLGLVVVVGLAQESATQLPDARNAGPQALAPVSLVAAEPLPPARVQSLGGDPVGATLGWSASGASAAPLPTALAPRSLPAVVFSAYLRAEQREASRAPGCHLSWSLLAGIGQEESGQARGHGAEQPGWNGIAQPPVYGPALDGNGFAAIPDSDGGALDGSAVWDRAVGPLQFLPSTWRRDGVDGDGDGRADPQDIFDAADTAGDYLCAGGRDLATASGLTAAVYSYNHSLDYVRAVLAATAGYGSSEAIQAARAALPVNPGPVAGGLVPSPVPSPTRPPSPAPAAAPVPTTPVSPAPASPGPSPGTAPSRSPGPSPTADPVTGPPVPTPTASTQAAPTPTPAAPAQAAPTPAGPATDDAAAPTQIGLP